MSAFICYFVIVYLTFLPLRYISEMEHKRSNQLIIYAYRGCCWNRNDEMVSLLGTKEYQIDVIKKYIVRCTLLYVSKPTKSDRNNGPKLAWYSNTTKKVKINTICHTSPPCPKTVSSTTSLNISMERQNPSIQSLLPISRP